MNIRQIVKNYRLICHKHPISVILLALHLTDYEEVKYAYPHHGDSHFQDPC